MSSSNNQLINVQPEELTFQFELEKQSYCDLKLANNTEHHVAFKVKTTSPKKYFVRPNNGVIQPWDSCIITVTLQAQQEYPHDIQCKDKFLLQSTIVPPNTDVDEIPQDAFNKDGEKAIEECKLRVVYTYPDTSHGNSEGEQVASRSSKQSFDTDFINAVQKLREEKDAVVRQNHLLQQELEMLRRRRRNRNTDSGFSLKFSAFVGLTGIIFGLLLRLIFSAPPTE